MSFDKYNKKKKKEYEDAFKLLCSDLLAEKYDNWIFEDNLFINSKNPFPYDWSNNCDITYDEEGFPCTAKFSHSCLDFWYTVHGMFPNESGELSYEQIVWVQTNIRKLTDTPYNNLLKRLHPIWSNEDIPVLKKSEELKKAFNYLLYGKEILEETSTLNGNEEKSKKENAKKADDNVTKSENCFYRVGDIWIVSYEGKPTQISHIKGMTYIYYLLCRPNKHISALELQLSENLDKSVKDVDSKAIMSEISDGEKKDGSMSIVNDDQKLKFTDEKCTAEPSSEDDRNQAKEFRNEMKKYIEAYEKAKREGSLEADELKKECDNLVKNYNSLFDIHGNARTNDKEEKSRIAVYKRIETAKRTIKKYIPNLNDHLSKHINTGKDIVYSPQKPINWQTTP